MIVLPLPSADAFQGRVPAAVPPEALAAPPAAATSSQLQPQMSYWLDAQLGIAVLQFRDPSGKVIQSRPTQQQLDAYSKPGAARPSVDGLFA